MTPGDREQLLHSLAALLGDYRRDGAPLVTPERVGRWLEQFLPDEQPVLLEELEQVFRRLYFSRARVRELVREFLRRYVVGGEAPEAALSHTRFLDLQQRGSSQRAYLRLVDELLEEESGRRLGECGAAGASHYVYLDDAVYTGNRLRHDLAGDGTARAPGWLRRAAPPGSTLWIFVTGCHTAGWRYALNYVRPEAERKGITFRLVPGQVVENDRTQPDWYECLWPEPSALHGAEDEGVARYVAGVQAELAARGFSDRFLFRDPGVPAVETLFTSREARTVVEQAFLRAGARLALSLVRQPHLRPLGFEVLDTLGYGTLLVTYRSIANNCPLALWWDAPGQWTPLLPRRVA